MELRIKKAGIEDVQVIVALANEIWPATYRDILAADQISYMMQLFYEPSSLEKQMIEKRHQFLVAETNDKAVAFASYSATDQEGVYKLHKLYVHPSMQGKGVGKRIIEYILEALHALKGQALELNVNRNNPARYFYEKAGFHILGEEDIDIGSGYLMNDYVMRKPVT